MTTKTKGRAKRSTGEIGCSAASNGRRITLEPIRTLRADLPFREVESTLPCGFRVEWASGDDKGKRLFQLNVGAGCGSRWGTFDYKGKQYCFDVEDLARALMQAIEDATAANGGGA